MEKGRDAIVSEPTAGAGDAFPIREVLGLFIEGHSPRVARYRVEGASVSFPWGWVFETWEEPILDWFFALHGELQDL